MFNNGFHNRPIDSFLTPFLSDFCPLGNPLLRMVQDLSYPNWWYGVKVKNQAGQVGMGAPKVGNKSICLPVPVALQVLGEGLLLKSLSSQPLPFWATHTHYLRFPTPFSSLCVFLPATPAVEVELK